MANLGPIELTQHWGKCPSSSALIVVARTVLLMILTSWISSQHVVLPNPNKF